MGNRQLLRRIMIYDVYLRQLVTLALKQKRERPADWQKPKVVTASEFDRNEK